MYTSQQWLTDHMRIPGPTNHCRSTPYDNVACKEETDEDGRSMLNDGQPSSEPPYIASTSHYPSRESYYIKGKLLFIFRGTHNLYKTITQCI